ncbi:MAG: LysM peptidoglycan-binding domain-containing M23 family metallopeptidase [Candidatus Dojkabacteria bacterium]|nr:LysM peptidoglycan-binding domain-containing M23 family metallopeptidase [Candidatus Dojkabacteria bacterium]
MSTLKNKKYFYNFLYEKIKYKLIYKLFWGRGLFYKNVAHFVIISITIFFLLSGLFSKFYAINISTKLYGTEAFGNYDLLQQGGTIETVSRKEKSLTNIETITHIVEAGEDLISIANKYNRKPETIRWMNRNVVSPFGNNIPVGSVIKIPKNLDGVLYVVKAGQTIRDIVQETGGNEFDVIEFNNLKPPYTLIEGQHLFIPDGTLYNRDINIKGIPKGVFSNPVGHPECSGYIITRGWLSYHNGVDIAKWSGCPIRAIAAGRVIYAGWAPGMGYNVQIDHGGGIVSHYYHASEVYVRTGQFVQQNDIIMYMGTTGNSTGVHLHLSLFKDGIAVDPAPFVPY